MITKIGKLIYYYTTIAEILTEIIETNIILIFEERQNIKEIMTETNRTRVPNYVKLIQLNFKPI